MRRTVRALLFVLIAGNVSLVGASWWLARESEREHPPVGTLVEVDGRAVHVRDHGVPADAPDAPTIALIHGASTSLLDLEASLVPALVDDFRVVTLDRPGHGYSERGEDWPDPHDQARTLRVALERVGVDEAVWVGHSWAGAVVLAALLDEPDHVRAGVLLAGATHPWEGGDGWTVETASRPLVGRAFAWQYVETAGRLVLDEAIASVFHPEPVPDAYVERTGVALSLRPRTYRANAIDRTRLSEYLAAQSTRYGTIARPLLSLTGTADEIVPAWNHHARLAAQLPALRSVALDGAGHAFHHTRTTLVASLIAAFARDPDLSGAELAALADAASAAPRPARSTTEPSR